MENQNDEKNWLIKSSHRILGPYTKSEVIDMIRKKHVSLLDEVRKPLIRWQSFRECKEFVEAVKMLQELEEAQEMTESQSTAPITLSKTEKVYDVSEDYENTQAEYNRPAPKETPSSSGYKDITTTKETVLPRHHSDLEASSKSFGMFNDHKRIQNIEKKSNQMRNIIFALIVLVVIGFFGQQFFLREKNDKNYQSLVASALRYKSLNLYDKSMDAYRKAKLIKKVDPDVVVKMAPLALMYDYEINPNRQILLNASQNESLQNRKVTVESLIALGLSFVKEGNFEKAYEYYQKALSYESFSEAALINKAWVQIRQNHYQEAYVTLGKLNSPRAFKAPYLYTKAIVLIQLAQKRPMNEEFKSLIQDIENELQSSSFLQNQLRLVSIRIQQIMNDPAVLLRSIEKYLELEPGFSQDLVKNYLLDWSFTSNDSIWSLCEAISSGLSTSSLTTTFKAFCAIETERSFESQKWIDEALAMNLNSSHTLHVQAFLLWNEKKISEAMALIQKSQSQLFPTTKSLLGRLCVQQKDPDCLTSNLNESKNAMSARSQSYAALAAWAIANNKTAEALQNIRSGIEVNNEYKPLIEMRSSLESMDE